MKGIIIHDALLEEIQPSILPRLYSECNPSIPTCECPLDSGL